MQEALAKSSIQFTVSTCFLLYLCTCPPVRHGAPRLTRVPCSALRCRLRPEAAVGAGYCTKWAGKTFGWIAETAAGLLSFEDDAGIESGHSESFARAHVHQGSPVDRCLSPTASDFDGAAELERHVAGCAIFVILLWITWSSSDFVESNLDAGAPPIPLHTSHADCIELETFSFSWLQTTIIVNSYCHKLGLLLLVSTNINIIQLMSMPHSFYHPSKSTKSNSQQPATTGAPRNRPGPRGSTRRTATQCPHFARSTVARNTRAVLLAHPTRNLSRRGAVPARLAGTILAARETINVLVSEPRLWPIAPLSCTWLRGAREEGQCSGVHMCNPQLESFRVVQIKSILRLSASLGYGLGV